MIEIPNSDQSGARALRFSVTGSPGRKSRLRAVLTVRAIKNSSDGYSGRGRLGHRPQGVEQRPDALPARGALEPADEQRLVRTIKEKFPDQKDQV